MQRAPLWLRKPTVPGRAISAAKVAFRPRHGVHHAQAVGPDQPHPPAPRLLQHLPLELGPLRADLLEPGRDDDRPLHPGLDALADHAGHGRRRGHDDRQVDRLGHRRDLGYALIPSTLGRFGLTGKTVPPNGLLIRFHRIVRPTLPAFSVAPITATVLVRRSHRAAAAARRGRGGIGSWDRTVGSLMKVLSPKPITCQFVKQLPHRLATGK